MTGIRVSITRLVDTEHQPGWVECRFVDAAGREHFFVEKVPILTSEDLWSDSLLPRPGVIACTVIGANPENTEIVIVDTDQPYSIASCDGPSCFEVLRRDLVAS